MVILDAQLFAGRVNPFSAAGTLDHVDVVVVGVVAFLAERAVVPPLPERDTFGAEFEIEVPTGHHSRVGFAGFAANAFDASPDVLPLAGFRRVDRWNAFGVVDLPAAVTLQHLVPLVSFAAFETSLTFGTQPVHRVNILNLQFGRRTRVRQERGEQIPSKDLAMVGSPRRYSDEFSGVFDFRESQKWEIISARTREALTSRICTQNVWYGSQHMAQ